MTVLLLIAAVFALASVILSRRADRGSEICLCVSFALVIFVILTVMVTAGV